ncbi:hypothetical protein BABINDRAFT_47764 [Babjeviella inositovora NRRL Y-12698]|uniref:NAD-dependent epimerase/dehydratase domain-containing protein n=1 Tax=Babjeviella inositovora NRRL Y-12698 TaxID=984486 RepID=A0A1E3QSN0_9ASCO|nr:uncharacterized protein BABINDRAFT_47764 [Babjeviella inositovora NRRL Y-12698]ODQ80648.1 hypothetical protein BABINDRAFT_47764 [Babjeviella inositovora NRRL Y-12698]
MSTDMKTVLVTGGTGFIGAHIANTLLTRGIHVVLTTRSVKKAKEFVNARTQYADLIKVFLIEDFCGGDAEGKPNPFILAAKGVDGIIHVASPLSYEVNNVEKELILPAIYGVKMILEAAAQTPTVKRLVLTSSFVSVLDVSRGSGPGFTYTGEDWNPLSYEEAVSADAVVGYRGSKKFSELEAWNFVKTHSSAFDLVTFCPPVTFGPIVHPIDNVKLLNLSNAVLWGVASGDDPLPQTRVPLWIDVRDLALAHVEGLIRPEAGGKRYIPCSPYKFSYDLAAQILKENGLGEFVTDNINQENLQPQGYDGDYETVERDLGIKFRSFKETVLDSIKEFRTLPR